MARAGVRSGEVETGAELGAEEPLPEWERELLVSGGQSAGAPVDATVGAGQNGTAAARTEATSS